MVRDVIAEVRHLSRLQGGCTSLLPVGSSGNPACLNPRLLGGASGHVQSDRPEAPGI